MPLMSNVRAFQSTMRASPMRTTPLLLLVLCASASAMTDEEFDRALSPKRCAEQATSLAHLFAARDKGLTLEEAKDLSRNHRDGELLPDETIRDVYEYRWLGNGAHYGYFLWTCKAKSLGLPVLPLSQVANDLQACLKKANDPCGRAIRNRIIGLKSANSAAKP